jgi:hypothetical protein
MAVERSPLPRLTLSMSVQDRLTIFLAFMTFVSTMTGVAGTFITYAQFKRESEAKAAAARQRERERVESGSSAIPAAQADTPESAGTGFSLGLKSKFQMSVGSILLAIILGLVWKGTSSTLVAKAGMMSNFTGSSHSGGEAEDGQVSISNTREFSGGQLYISLNSTDSKGDPPRYSASFTVGTAEGKVKKIGGEEAGFIMEFQGFNVRLISVSATDATFQVRKKEEAKPQA